MKPLRRVAVLGAGTMGSRIAAHFANAGVPIKVEAFRDPVAIAVVLGLVIGKPLGIMLFSWLAVRIGIARLPADVSWSVIAAGGVLAGL